MSLSRDLVSQFVKITKNEKKAPTEATVHGTVVYDGKLYVKLDGSDLLTPVSTTTSAGDGDRVAVTIRNHEATITGNLSDPSASSATVTEHSGRLDEFETIIAHRIVADDIEATTARIEQLEATIANIGSLSAEEIEALNAEIENIQAKIIDTEYLKSTDIEAINADIENLRAKFGEFDSLTADDLEAINADIDFLKSYSADFTYVSTEVLSAVKADIKTLNTEKLSATEADLKYANIDFANIGEAAIEKLFSASGIISDLVMSDGKVTGTLTAIRINADWIQSGTLQTDRLLLKGPDGLYYALNVTENGDTTVTDRFTAEELQNGLLGSNIIAKSITAEKIAVDDLTAFNAYLAGFNIKELEDAEGNYLTSAIYSGVKQSVHNPLDGIYMDKDGQLAVGNGNEYLKFYKGDDGKFHLAIAASNIMLSTGKTVEETVDEAKNIKIGARNLIRNSKTLIFTSHYFLSNPSGINSTSMLGEATLGDMILGEE